MEIQINPKFRDLLPPLGKAELEHLRESVLEEGIREPLRLWEGQLVDGHNRYELAQEYDIEFDTDEMIFENEDAVCEWIMVNQLGRRNLEVNIKKLLIGQLYELRKKRQGPTERNKDGQFTISATVALMDTAEEIAQEFDVSPRTVKTAGSVARAFDRADEDVKEDFKQGKVSQKELVEKAKPKPVVDTGRFDEHTQGFALCGHRIAAASTQLLKAIDEYRQYCFKAKIKAEEISPIIHDPANTKVVTVLQAAGSALKSLEICPACEAKGCGRCGETGYKGATEAGYIRKELGK